MPKKKKNIILSIVGVTLILLMLLGATYAYFQAQIKDGASSEVAIDTDTVDVLTFNASNDIVFEATQENFGREEGNISGTTILNAHLIANNTNQTASYKYNVYLDITKNNFVYSKDSNTPEIVLVIKNPRGQYVTKTNSKIGKTTKVDLKGKQVTGYDITTKLGLIEISIDYLIEATSSTKGIANQDWEISVVLVNLDSNQVANAGKSFKAKAKVQSEKINVLDLGGIEYAYYRGTSSSSGYRNQIKNVYFVNYIKEEELNSVGEDANWDLSSVKDKSIMGWLKNENDDATAPYNLYIGSNLKEGEKIVVRSFAYAFYKMSNLETIDLNLEILDTSNLNNTSHMFSGYDYNASYRSNMKISTIIGIKDLDVSNVTNMSYMFYNANSLTTLDLSNWNTSNVTNMSNMFYRVSSLTTIGDLSGWDTSNVTNMSYMFYNANSLTTLDLSNWNTSNVTNMSHMFDGASSLTTIGDLSNWNVQNVIDMSYMFSWANNSIIPDLSKWDTSNVTNMSGLFNSTSYNYDVSKIDTHNVTDMKYMFDYYKGTDIKGIEELDVSNVTNMSHMFNGASSLTTLDLSNWDTHNVTNMSDMFSGSCSLITLDLSNWSTSKVTNMSKMFYGYMYGEKNLKEIIGIKNFDVLNVTNMSQMFQGRNGLIALDLSSWNTSKVTDMSSMFAYSNGLTSIDMRKVTFSQLTSYREMFRSTNSELKVTITGDANKSWFLDSITNDTNFGLKESQLNVLPS